MTVGPATPPQPRPARGASADRSSGPVFPSLLDQLSIGQLELGDPAVSFVLVSEICWTTTDCSVYIDDEM